jgi:hypothetical protein
VERRSGCDWKVAYGEQSRCCPAISIAQARVVHAGGELRCGRESLGFFGFGTETQRSAELRSRSPGTQRGAARGSPSRSTPRRIDKPGCGRLQRGARCEEVGNLRRAGSPTNRSSGALAGVMMEWRPGAPPGVLGRSSAQQLRFAGVARAGIREDSLAASVAGGSERRLAGAWGKPISPPRETLKRSGRWPRSPAAKRTRGGARKRASWWGGGTP